jgi:CheY-like chemotaxis protein
MPSATAARRAAQVLRRGAPPPQATVLAVQYNGLDISKLQQRQLVRLFQRLHTHVAGPGVGLYLAKRLAENGGTTAGQSQPNVGTIFTGTIPSIRYQAIFCTSMLQRLRVLLVDDDQTTNFLNKLLLTRLQVTEQVLVATNGEEALRVLAQQGSEPATRPNLILLDMNMPVLNGLAFLEAYAQLPSTVQDAIVIVMLTTSLHPVDLARAQQLPIAGFLNKPLTEAKVADLLREHFAAEYS